LSQGSATRPLFGVLTIDKPAGMTSRDCVNRVQKLIRPDRTRKNPTEDTVEGHSGVDGNVRAEKVGHTGTLDPMATGVLLVVVGQATRLVDYAHQLPKTYEADFLLGCTSDTLDTTGRIATLPNPPGISRLALQEALPNWLGSILQTPPHYSAVHVHGKRAYDLARRGEKFDIPPRATLIHELELLDFEYPLFTIRVRCSTGTYIRSLGSDMAAALGSGAVMSRLVRTEIGPYRLVDCARLDAFVSRQDIVRRLAPPLQLLGDLPKAMVDDVLCQRLRQGKMLTMDGPLDALVDGDGQQAVIVDRWEQPVAIVAGADGQLRPIRVFIS